MIGPNPSEEQLGSEQCQTSKLACTQAHAPWAYVAPALEILFSYP
jgi:hypothetical protein